ncbi:tetratricopeptide repeat protein [Streptomyces griseorubiginosus]|uniref:tetratricopeptide repeat protein n=1 Tax=Streptomyces griseorubiginosus TaxID=67304 RepID=UPI0036E3C623
MADMTRARVSMQELIAQRRRAGFVGRGVERAAFRTNFDLPPEDERHRFLFHVHGNAGVGKTFLVRELEQLAREKGALTAYVDESVDSLPEAMAAISRQLGAQGVRIKELDRLLAAHRERRHEAEAAALATLDTEDGGPSAGSLAVARAGLVGLGMVPGVGAFAGVLDAGQLAQGADRLRAGLSARLRTQEDVQLVLHPERVLTPVLLRELTDAAASAPWIVLLFDTYERTGPFLDGWLHETMTGDRHGTLPATVVVVTAGQRPFDTARWGAFADFMTDVPLGPFTEAEARGLLAAKGVVAEPVVEEVLRLTGGLPVLVSTLAEQRPTDPDDIGDPSATAVERFLRWEQDPVRRSAALACALPRQLDLDVFRAAVDCDDREADALFGWLRALPFVVDRGDRLRYHDLVREAMLRMQRSRSPRGWAEQHRSLAGKFGAWRAEYETGREEFERWTDERWRELRLAESYHLLCAQEPDALPDVLRDFTDACGTDDATAARWARVLLDAGRDGDTEPVSRWGSELSRTLTEGGVPAALARLLSRADLDEPAQTHARVVRGTALRRLGALEEALHEYDLAVDLGEALCTPDLPAGSGDTGRAPDLAVGPGETGCAQDSSVGPGETGCAQDSSVGPGETGCAQDSSVGPGETRRAQDSSVGPGETGCAQDSSVGPGETRRAQDPAVARGDTPRAPEGAPAALLADLARAHRGRAYVRGELHDYEAAIDDLDRALALEPDSPSAHSVRGEYHRALHHDDAALRDLDRGIALDPAHHFAWASRGALHLTRGDLRAARADLDRSLELNPDYVWALVRRARVWRGLGDPARRLADLDRAVALQPDWPWGRCERGDALRNAGRVEEALRDYDHVLALDPDYASAHASRGAALAVLGRHEEAVTALDNALRLNPDYTWALCRRAESHLALGAEALARTDADRACELSPDDEHARAVRDRVRGRTG